jgi:hypothetical protein
MYVAVKDRLISQVTELSFCEQIALTETPNYDITRVQRKVYASDTKNQTRHLLALLTMMLQGIIDGCLPELEEIRKLNAFLTSSHLIHGSSSLSTSQLTDWIARMCLGMQGKSTAIPTCPVNKRRRSSTPIQDPAQPEMHFVLRYAVLSINTHYHGLDNHLMYNVTWHEPGSSNTLESYANVHHLDALSVYEQRLEASAQIDYCKALYLL